MNCSRCGARVREAARACDRCHAPIEGTGRRPRAASLVHDIGDHILGRYRVEDIVGSGGMGVVYRARHTNGAGVAVKIINAKLMQSPEDRERFTTELERTRALVHENVLEIIDAGFDGGRPYVVTPFLEGLSLRRIIDLRREKGRIFSLAEVDPIAEQFAHALEALRTIPVVHGDLKPENVIVLPDVLKVTDLGLFAGLPHRTFLAIQHQRATGWPYLAPEVRNESGPLGAAADLYSLGVILGEMLTGAVFDDSNPQAFLRACERLPAAAQTALMSALATAPLDRPASPGALLAGLRGQSDQGDAPTQRVELDLHHLSELGGAGPMDATTPGRRRPAPPTILREEGRPVASPSPSIPPDSELPSITGDLLDDDATEAALDALEAFGALEEMSGSSVELLEEPGLILVSHEEKARIDVLSSSGPSEVPLLSPVEAPATTRSPPPAPEVWDEPPEPTEAAPPPTNGASASVASAGPWVDPDEAESSPVTADLVTNPERPPPPVAEPVTRVSSSDILDVGAPLELRSKGEGSRRVRTLVAGGVAVGLLLFGSILYLLWDNSRQLAAQNARIAQQDEQIQNLKSREAAAKAAAEAADAKAVEASEKVQKAEREAAALEKRKAEQAAAAAAALARRKVAEEEARRASTDDRREAAEARAAVARQEESVRKEAELEAGREVRAARARVEREREAKDRAAEEAAAARAQEAAVAQERAAALEEGSRKANGGGAPEAATGGGAAAAAARGAPPPEGPSGCPRGMTLVSDGTFMIGAPANDPERNFGDQPYRSLEVSAFCIDYYEYPNGRSRIPTTGLNWAGAKGRCERRGKRLCTEPEWEKACKGPGGARYPYANAWDPTRCNTEDGEGSDRPVVGSGTFRRCRSGYDVFDLGGNVAEWTSTANGSGYVVKGGSSDRPGYDSRCASRATRAAGSQRESLGFRCCADPG